ncbi:hypothetical protein G7A72_14880 [Flavobacterium sp. Sr18]|uniref:hypothetical protein n=1 Tax=Flavobacterium sp. Sr18 TaxID=935222 RepID=UPI0013E51B8D|nr:hypothetical protein [Flavobacterium sp. Sr18]QIH40021.1 hypothetical protein G7A72_14880 [Flavobacterium sp. Sr18]
MKKLTFLLVLLLICFESYSQSMTTAFEEAAKKDLVTLKKIAVITKDQEQPLLDFFYRKYKQYSVYTLSQVQKKEIFEQYEIELKNLIGPQNEYKLVKNREIFKSLITE